MKNHILSIFVLVFLLPAVPETSRCQSTADSGPVMIKVNKVLLQGENQYMIYIPSFEFHMFFQKRYSMIQSAVSADYDYQRQDMGFGMSHGLWQYSVNPGISVDDNLYFRKVFSDSTGIWRRRQSIAPFLSHRIDDHNSVGVEFRFDREWSPKRRQAAKIVSSHDRMLRFYYQYFSKREESYEQTSVFVSVERSYRILQGEYNYFVVHLMARKATRINERLHLKSSLRFTGNVTPQDSPLYFLGGHRNLIGYENDEFWGRKRYSLQNIFAYQPFPGFSIPVMESDIRRIVSIFEIDVGGVRGAPALEDLKTQPDDIKFGFGLGFGFTTDLPYMEDTDLHFMLAAPGEDPSNVKFYAGLGEWTN